ncbi:hypothetical protein [Paenibacillus xylanexedens]|uniref:hypothetical protein n=1 Tax=Paenibacillus xylanexedens TaxID=528191 RepID=UPI0011A27B9E|nr:hypothetical protein [Paenibacillus xylanexedens]
MSGKSMLDEYKAYRENLHEENRLQREHMVRFKHEKEEERKKINRKFDEKMKLAEELRKLEEEEKKKLDDELKKKLDDELKKRRETEKVEYEKKVMQEKQKNIQIQIEKRYLVLKLLVLLLY